MVHGHYCVVNAADKLDILEPYHYCKDGSYHERIMGSGDDGRLTIDYE